MAMFIVNCKNPTKKMKFKSKSLKDKTLGYKSTL